MEPIINTHWYRVMRVEGRTVYLNWEDDALDTFRIRLAIPEDDEMMLESLIELGEHHRFFYIVENQDDMNKNDSALTEVKRSLFQTRRFKDARTGEELSET